MGNQFFNFMCNILYVCVFSVVDQPPMEILKKTKTENSIEIEVPYILVNITLEYKFEYRAVKSNFSKWQMKTFKPTVSNTYYINGLIPWTEYEIKVKPIHRAGRDVGRSSSIKRFKTLQGGET